MVELVEGSGFSAYRLPVVVDGTEVVVKELLLAVVMIEMELVVVVGGGLYEKLRIVEAVAEFEMELGAGFGREFGVAVALWSEPGTAAVGLLGEHGTAVAL